LHLEVVAEGVELQYQRDRLRAAHCDFAQGYLFAGPLDQADAELLLVQLKGADLADRPGVTHFRVAR
jgi:EAL domain-containing protein (putative c-di-GMP-specific phosphodiesterase class I)